MMVWLIAATASRRVSLWSYSSQIQTPIAPTAPSLAPCDLCALRFQLASPLRASKLTLQAASPETNPSFDLIDPVQSQVSLAE